MAIFTPKLKQNELKPQTKENKVHGAQWHPLFYPLSLILPRG